MFCWAVLDLHSYDLASWILRRIGMLSAESISAFALGVPGHTVQHVRDIEFMDAILAKTLLLRWSKCITELVR
jgi:hypothetical protein